MKNLLVAGCVIAGFGIGSMHSAEAANTALILWNGADPADAEAATGVGSASLLGSNLDGITITVSNVNRETNPNGITESNINLDNTTGSVQVLHIIAGANGFLGPSKEFGLSATILTALGASNLTGSFFADNTNSLNGESFGVTGNGHRRLSPESAFNGPRSFSFNGDGFDSVTGPLRAGGEPDPDLAGRGRRSAFNRSRWTPWAVPGTPHVGDAMAMGFGLLALLGVKRKRTRFAV